MRGDHLAQESLVVSFVVLTFCTPQSRSFLFSEIFSVQVKFTLCLETHDGIFVCLLIVLVSLRPADNGWNEAMNRWLVVLFHLLGYLKYSSFEVGSRSFTCFACAEISKWIHVSPPRTVGFKRSIAKVILDHYQLFVKRVVLITIFFITLLVKSFYNNLKKCQLLFF